MAFRVLSIRVQGSIRPQVRSQILAVVQNEFATDAVVLDLIDSIDSDAFVTEVLAYTAAPHTRPALRVITKSHGSVIIHSNADREVVIMRHLPRPSPTAIEGVQWEELVLPDDRAYARF
jgi:hypothetical protein